MSMRSVTGRYNGPELEQQILEFWRDQNVFKQTLEMSEGRPLFTFNEGPPTANGKPGIHHVLARSFKDVFPRYKTMQGYHVPRKAGWDTHGLPIETALVKNKKVKRHEIPKVEFRKLCAEYALEQVDKQREQFKRLGILKVRILC